MASFRGRVWWGSDACDAAPNNARICHPPIAARSDGRQTPSFPRCSPRCAAPTGRRRRFRRAPRGPRDGAAPQLPRPANAAAAGRRAPPGRPAQAVPAESRRPAARGGGSRLGRRSLAGRPRLAQFGRGDGAAVAHRRHLGREDGPVTRGGVERLCQPGAVLVAESQHRQRATVRPPRRLHQPRGQRLPRQGQARDLGAGLRHLPRLRVPPLAARPRLLLPRPRRLRLPRRGPAARVVRRLRDRHDAQHALRAGSPGQGRQRRRGRRGHPRPDPRGAAAGRHRDPLVAPLAVRRGARRGREEVVCGHAGLAAVLGRGEEGGGLRQQPGNLLRRLCRRRQALFGAGGRQAVHREPVHVPPRHAGGLGHGRDARRDGPARLDALHRLRPASARQPRHALGQGGHPTRGAERAELLRQGRLLAAPQHAPGDGVPAPRGAGQRPRVVAARAQGGEAVQALGRFPGVCRGLPRVGQLPPPVRRRGGDVGRGGGHGRLGDQGVDAPRCDEGRGCRAQRRGAGGRVRGKGAHEGGGQVRGVPDQRRQGQRGGVRGGGCGGGGGAVPRERRGQAVREGGDGGRDEDGGGEHAAHGLGNFARGYYGHACSTYSFIGLGRFWLPPGRRRGAVAPPGSIDRAPPGPAASPFVDPRQAT